MRRSSVPKSITLGRGTPSFIVTRIFDGLMSPVDDPFLVRVLNGLAERGERSSRSFVERLFLVAIIGDLDAAHQFHDEIRTARVRRPRV